MKTCTIPGCGRKHQARGWCSTHYTRWRIHGDPNLAMPTGRPPKDTPKKARPTGTPCTTKGCRQPAHARGLCNRCYKRAWRQDEANAGWLVTCGDCGAPLGPLPTAGPWVYFDRHQCKGAAA